jgi:hypothetical protein
MEKYKIKNGKKVDLEAMRAKKEKGKRGGKKKKARKVEQYG